MIYIGADHRGYDIKEKIKSYLKDQELEHEDLGNFKYEKNDDFPEFANLVVEKVLEDPERNRGILICGSGVGMDMAANRNKNIRSALAMTPEMAIASRKSDNTNVLSLGADFVGEKKVEEIIEAWLGASFSGEERHQRRLTRIDT